MKGLIFSIKKYSVHDGPGIRVTFFMKGCPLGCLWCHNPEGISPVVQTVTQKNRIGNREFSREETVGEWYSVDDVLDILDREKIFFDQSGGGVTFSGGEPMMQFDFLLAALKECHEKGYHTTVDTSGYSASANFVKIMPFTDLFLFDIKHVDEETHYNLTGVSNSLILENYRLLLRDARNMMVRIPVIPGYNDDQAHIEKLRDFIVSAGMGSVRKINLLPYHKIGASKYKKFNIPRRIGEIDPPGKERLHMLKEFFAETGIPVKIGG